MDKGGKTVSHFSHLFSVYYRIRSTLLLSASELPQIASFNYTKTGKVEIILSSLHPQFEVIRKGAVRKVSPGALGPVTEM